MSERNESFTVGDEPRVEVRIGAGSIRLVEGRPGIVEVTAKGSGADDLVIEQRGDAVVVSQVGGRRLTRSIELTVRVPEATEADLKLASGSLATEATLRGLTVNAASADTRVRTVRGPVGINSASGDVVVEAVEGRFEAKLASGDIDVAEAAGAVDVKSASGDVRLGRVGGRVSMSTASGDLEIGSFEGPELACKSLSGDVRIGIPPGRTVEVDIQTLSGDVRNQFGLSDPSSPPGSPASLRVKTVSGDVVLRSAS